MRLKREVASKSSSRRTTSRTRANNERFRSKGQDPNRDSADTFVEKWEAFWTAIGRGIFLLLGGLSMGLMSLFRSQAPDRLVRLGDARKIMGPASAVIVASLLSRISDYPANSIGAALLLLPDSMNFSNVGRNLVAHQDFIAPNVVMLTVGSIGALSVLASKCFSKNKKIAKKLINWTAYQYLLVLVCYAIGDTLLDQIEDLDLKHLVAFMLACITIIPACRLALDFRNTQKRCATFSAGLLAVAAIVGAVILMVAYDWLFLKSIGVVASAIEDFSFRATLKSEPFEGIGAHCAGSKGQSQSYLTCQLLVINSSKVPFVIYAPPTVTAYIDSIQELAFFGKKATSRVNAALGFIAPPLASPPPVLVESGKTISITVKFGLEKLACDQWKSAQKAKDAKVLLSAEALFNDPDIISSYGVLRFYQRQVPELPTARSVGKWSVPLEQIDGDVLC
jgi:hypothetical protein